MSAPVATSGTLVLLGLLVAGSAPLGAQSHDDHAGHHEDHAAAAGDTASAARLTELQALAMERNPELLALRAMAEAAGTRVAEAGTLPDPVLMVGAMNLALPEFDRSMPASMLPSIQLSQSFPFFGKLELREAMAAADSQTARLAVEEAEWRVRGQVASRFWALYSLDERLAVQRRTLELLQEFQSVARALYASGTGRQGDVIRADVEVGRLDASIRRLEALRVGEAARLGGLLDMSGEPVAERIAVPANPASNVLPGLETLVSWAMESRPALQSEMVKVERARRGIELAERDFWPDFTVSAQYGRGGGAEPRNMGGLMIGASIPIHSGSRQRPRLEAARALERHALASQSGVRNGVESELRAVLADVDRARSLMTLYEAEIIPAAVANVTSSLASYRVDEVDFATLVDAQLAVDRYEQEYHQLVADYGAAVALLESVVARPLTSSSGMSPEVQ